MPRLVPGRWPSVLLLCVAVGCHTVPPAEPFRYPEGQAGAGELRYINDIPVLSVAGTPEEMGAQVGTLAVKPGERLTHYPREMLGHFCLGWLWPKALRQGEALLPQFPPDHRREMDAIAEAAPEVKRENVVAGNTLFDVKKMVACSSIIVEPTRSRTGTTLLGRNLDFPPLDYLHEYTLVVIYHPVGKHAFAAVTFPGMVGCLSGMNDAGLALTMHEVFQAGDGSALFNEHGMPYALAFRRVLEECTTVEEAAQLLESLPRTTANNLALADRYGHSAVLEISTGKIVVRQTTDGVNFCTNHFVSPELRPAVPLHLYGTGKRYRALAKWAAQPTFDRADVAAALHEVNKDSHTIQTMIFEPQTLTLHLAIGPGPTTARPLRTLELTPLLRPGPAVP